MTTVRVKPDVACVVYDHRAKATRTLVPGMAFDDSDPFVQDHEWAFESDVERDARVEQATAAPGEKRNARRGGNR